MHGLSPMVFTRIREFILSYLRTYTFRAMKSIYQHDRPSPRPFTALVTLSMVGFRYRAHSNSLPSCDRSRTEVIKVSGVVRVRPEALVSRRCVRIHEGSSARHVKRPFRPGTLCSATPWASVLGVHVSPEISSSTTMASRHGAAD